MKTNKYDLFIESINNSIQKIENPLFSELKKVFEIEIAALYKKGILAFEDDYKLTGFPLECKVKKVFKDFGFSISRGRCFLQPKNDPLFQPKLDPPWLKKYTI